LPSINPRDFGAAAPRAALRRSLADLRTEYIDLALLHYSECWGDLCDGAAPEGGWREAWRALEAGVQFETYSTIGGQYMNAAGAASPVLSHPVVAGIAAARGSSAARVVLLWALQYNQTVVPRSADAARAADNLGAAGAAPPQSAAELDAPDAIAVEL
jgi:diketogulonate reductase-like aldo/keto reductase